MGDRRAQPGFETYLVALDNRARVGNRVTKTSPIITAPWMVVARVGVVVLCAPGLPPNGVGDGPPTQRK